MSLDDLQAQLRGALDQQFATLRQQYEEALNKAREQARVEAEQQASARIAAARAEIETQMAAIVSATRAEAKQEAEATARLQRQQLEQELQQQLEQTVQHAVNSVRRTSELELESLRRRHDQELQAERARVQAAIDEHRGQSEQALQEAQGRHAEAQRVLDEQRRQALDAIEEERGRAAAELEAVKQLLEAEIASAQAEAAAAREEAQTAAARAEPAAPPPAPALAQVPDAIRTLDLAASLSQTLEALLHHSAAIAGRAALFLVNGDRLKAWKASGIPDIDVQTVESSIGGRDLLARAIQAGRATEASSELPAPPFARLTGGEAIAVPLMINGRAVAVLYADTGAAPPAGGWTDGVDAVVRYAATLSALRAAMRTLDVLRGDVPQAEETATAANGNGEESARRYARLLVSEIKLYNEAAVRAGQQQRDLRQRLRGEIDRAQRLYEERVPPAVGARDQYFQQELVQTLADGDPSLLGN